MPGVVLCCVVIQCWWRANNVHIHAFPVIGCADWQFVIGAGLDAFDGKGVTFIICVQGISVPLCESRREPTCHDSEIHADSSAAAHHGM